MVASNYTPDSWNRTLIYLNEAHKMVKKQNCRAAVFDISIYIYLSDNFGIHVWNCKIPKQFPDILAAFPKTYLEIL